jgi:hypothetical protein
MGVAEEHLEIPMAADQRHFGNRETKFEESTDRLVAEVMEMKVFDLGSVLDSFPRQAKGVSGDWKDDIAGALLFLQNFYSG